MCELPPRTNRWILLLTSAVLMTAAVQGCSREDIRPGDGPPSPEVGSPWNSIVVTGSVVNLRAGPGTEYQVLGRVEAGDTLLVTGGLDDWYRVYLSSMSLFAWIYGPLTTGTELPR